jgi:hypothetical protein
VKKLSTRLGDCWLILTQVREDKWRLQVLGDTPLEAEVTADDEAGAKESAVAATVEKLRSEGVATETPATVNWNAVVTQRFNKHS